MVINNKTLLTSMVALVVAMLAVMAMPSQLAAQIYGPPTNWQGPATGGDWFDPANWSDGLPAANSPREAHSGIGQILNSSITLGADDAEAQVSTLRLNSSSLLLDGGKLLIANTNRTETNGYGAFGGLEINSTAGGEAGLLHLSNGAILRSEYRNRPTDTPELNRVTILAGSGEGSVGNIIIEDEGTEAHASFIIGRSGGQGSLIVRGGATVNALTASIGGSSGNITPSNSTGHGSVLVTGQGTTWTGGSISLGHDLDEGRLDVEAGAKVTLTNGISAGFYKNDFNEGGGVGVIRLTGDGTEVQITEYIINGSTVIKGGVLLGGTGDGTLIISDGALLQTAGGNIVLGREKGQVVYNDPYSYDSHGTIQIGEGGRAGTLVVPEITTGHGSGTVIFNHNESSYDFTAKITEMPPVLPPRSFEEPDPKPPGQTSVVVRSGGRTVMSGDSNYSGGTVIENGTIVAAHQRALGWGSVDVQSGSRLAIAPEVTNLKLGNIVTLTYPDNETIDIEYKADLQFAGGSTLEFTAGDDFDSPLIEIEGSLTLNADSSDPWNIHVLLSQAFDYSSSFDWTFLTTTDGIEGFDVDAISFNLEGWSILQDGNNLVLSYVVVPEPARVLLMLLAFGALLMRRQRPLTRTA